MTLSLGPIVGHTDAESSRIWLQTTSPGTVRLRVYRDAARSQEVGEGFAAASAAAAGNTAVLTATGLAPDTRYFYDIEDANGQSVVGPSASKLTFRTFPDSASTPAFKFGLASCNKTFVGKKAPRFNVWKRLGRAVEREEVRLLIQCGDQIYADRAYKRLAKKALPGPDESVAAYRNEYGLQWGHKEITEVLCGVPNYMIWDDHEINNGWGAHIRDTTAKKRRAIFRGARHAYSEFQHSHNPQTFGADRFHYAFRYGTMGFVVLDMRGQRDSTRKRLPILGARQWQEFKGWIGTELASLTALCVVVSVPVAHSPSFVANLIPKSDLRDQWSYAPNRPERASLVRFLFDVANQQDMPVVLLSGDVHVGSFARIRSTRSEHRTRPEIYQFTSSPICNHPSKLLAKLQLGVDRKRRIDKGIHGRILRIFGRRNFGLIGVEPGAGGRDTKFRFELFEEGRSQPHTIGPV